MSLWRDEGTALRKSSRYFDKFSVSLPKDTVFTLTAKRVSFPSVEKFFILVCIRNHDRLFLRQPSKTT